MFHGNQTVGTPNALRGIGGLIVACAISDWLVKLSHPLWAGDWYPHRVERPALLIVLALGILIIPMALMFARPLIVLGAGLGLGGATANMLNLQATGVVWDMFHWGDIVFNLADLFIMFGFSFFSLGMLRALHQFLYPQRVPSKT